MFFIKSGPTRFSRVSITLAKGDELDRIAMQQGTHMKRKVRKYFFGLVKFRESDKKFRKRIVDKIQENVFR